MGKKRSRKAVKKPSEDALSSEQAQPLLKADPIACLSEVQPQPTPGNLIAPEEQRSRDAEAMDAMVETLLSKKLQILVKEKQKSQVKESKVQIVGQPSGIFDRTKLDQDQLINRDEEPEYALQQRQVFQAYACQICKSVRSTDNSTLKRCNNCKMIFYCSKEHQVEHWSEHKELCKVIGKVCKNEKLKYLFENAGGLNADEFRSFRIKRVDQCARLLIRPIQLWEREMFYYTPACQTCHIADRELLTACSQCLHVNFCKPDHLNAHHAKWCALFRLYRDIIFHQAENGMMQPSLPSKMFTEYRPLCDSINKFFLDAFGLGISMQWNRLTYSVVTDIATCPLTALYALQKCELDPPLEARKELTIHLAGAESHFEADTVNKWELLLLHLLPKLQTLHVVFVGPELREQLPETTPSQTCCDQCRHAGKKVDYEFHPGSFYHDYADSPRYCLPDLICAFNAGLYRNTGFDGSDTWLPTIRTMLRDPAVPVVVTAYTAHELPRDVARMQQQCPDNFKVILQPTQNPFSSSKPSLNFIDEEEVPIIFKNFYISIVKSV